MALLLNVVHHTGDDYGDPCHDKEGAKRAMLKNINEMARYADTLVFQMGSNWKGDVKKCLFDHGTKAEMIAFIRDGTVGHWRIDAIGIAERDGQEVQYANLDEKNIARDDALGEFLNRPIFILQAER